MSDITIFYDSISTTGRTDGQTHAQKVTLAFNFRRGWTPPTPMRRREEEEEETTSAPPPPHSTRMKSPLPSSPKNPNPSPPPPTPPPTIPRNGREVRGTVSILPKYHPLLLQGHPQILLLLPLNPFPSKGASLPPPSSPLHPKNYWAHPPNVSISLPPPSNSPLAMVDVGVGVNLPKRLLLLPEKPPATPMTSLSKVKPG